MVGICPTSSVSPNPSLPEIGEAYMISEKFDQLTMVGRRALVTTLRSSPTTSLPTRASLSYARLPSPTLLVAAVSSLEPQFPAEVT